MWPSIVIAILLAFLVLSLVIRLVIIPTFERYELYAQLKRLKKSRWFIASRSHQVWNSHHWPGGFCSVRIGDKEPFLWEDIDSANGRLYFSLAPTEDMPTHFTVYWLKGSDCLWRDTVKFLPPEILKTIPHVDFITLATDERTGERFYGAV